MKKIITIIIMMFFITINIYSYSSFKPRLVNLYRGDERIDERVYRGETLKLTWKDVDDDYVYNVSEMYFKESSSLIRHIEAHDEMSEKKLEEDIKEGNFSYKNIDAKVGIRKNALKDIIISDDQEFRYLVIKVDAFKESDFKPYIDEFDYESSFKVYKLYNEELRKIQVDIVNDGLKVDEVERLYHEDSNRIYAPKIKGFSLIDEDEKISLGTGSGVIQFNYKVLARKKIHAKFLDFDTFKKLGEKTYYSNEEVAEIKAIGIPGYSRPYPRIKKIKEDGYTEIKFYYNKEDGPVEEFETFEVIGEDEDGYVLYSKIIENIGQNKVYAREISGYNIEGKDFKYVTESKTGRFFFKYEDSIKMRVKIICEDGRDNIKIVEKEYEDKDYRNIYAPDVEGYYLEDEEDDFKRVGGKEEITVRFEYDEYDEYEVEIRAYDDETNEKIDEFIEFYEAKRGNDVVVYAPEIEGYNVKNKKYKLVDSDDEIKFYYIPYKVVTIKMYDEHNDLIDIEEEVFEEYDRYTEIRAPYISGYKKRGDTEERVMYLRDDTAKFYYEKIETVTISIKCYDYSTGDLIDEVEKKYTTSIDERKIYAPRIDDYDVYGSEFKEVEIDDDKKIRFYYKKDI